MSVKIETPCPALPPTYRPADAFAYRVKNGDSFVSVANRLEMSPKALLMFNYKTDHPPYVNYYLYHNVGCRVPSPDGKNYSFTNANPGVIYYPSFNPVVWFGPKQGGADPFSQFHMYDNGDLVIFDNPVDSTLIRVQTSFSLTFILHPRILDASLFVYRQYIRGRNRVMNEVEEWLDIPVPVTDPNNPNGWIYWRENEWLEDGAIEDGWRRYGHREDPAEPHDYYSSPNQTDGKHYQMVDMPSFDVPKNDLGKFLIRRGGRFEIIVDKSGHYPRKIEAEYYFMGRVLELNPAVPNRVVKIWKEILWDYKKKWRITKKKNPPLEATEYL
jgi:hypothetical protein